MAEKWFGLLLSNDESETFFAATQGDLFGCFDDRYPKSYRIDEWDERCWVGASDESEDGTPDDYLYNDAELEIVSAAVQQAMRESDIGVNDVQLLPIQVRKSTGEELPGYAVMNILPRIEALHRGQTFMLDEDPPEIDPATGKPRVYNFFKPAIYREAPRGHDLFRLLEEPSRVFCSARFAKLWKKHKFTGAGTSSVICVDEPCPKEFKKFSLPPAKIRPAR